MSDPIKSALSVIFATAGDELTPDALLRGLNAAGYTVVSKAEHGMTEVDIIRDPRRYIQRAMKITGLSATALAEKAHLTPTTLTRYLRTTDGEGMSTLTLCKIQDYVAGHRGE